MQTVEKISYIYIWLAGFNDAFSISEGAFTFLKYIRLLNKVCIN